MEKATGNEGSQSVQTLSDASAWKCKGSQKAGRQSGLKTAEVLHMQHLCLPRLDTRQVPITFSKSSIGELVSEEIVQTTWGEFS